MQVINCRVRGVTVFTRKNTNPFRKTSFFQLFRQPQKIFFVWRHLQRCTPLSLQNFWLSVDHEKYPQDRKINRGPDKNIFKPSSFESQKNGKIRAEIFQKLKFHWSDPTHHGADGLRTEVETFLAWPQLLIENFSEKFGTIFKSSPC